MINIDWSVYVLMLWLLIVHFQCPQFLSGLRHVVFSWVVGGGDHFFICPLWTCIFYYYVLHYGRRGHTGCVIRTQSVIGLVMVETMPCHHPYWCVANLSLPRWVDWLNSQTLVFLHTSVTFAIKMRDWPGLSDDAQQTVCESVHWVCTDVRG